MGQHFEGHAPLRCRGKQHDLAFTVLGWHILDSWMAVCLHIRRKSESTLYHLTVAVRQLMVEYQERYSNLRSKRKQVRSAAPNLDAKRLDEQQPMGIYMA